MSRRKTNRKQRSGKQRYAIVVDGQTEFWYFQNLKKHENLSIDILPKLPRKTKLKEQFEEVKEYKDLGYDKVIWLIDFDVVIKEEQERKKSSNSILNQLQHYLNYAQKHNQIEIYFNAPCLEFWYLLHFEQTSKYYPQCDTAAKVLEKKHLDGYEKTQKYYNKINNDIYKRLKPFLTKARQNAQLLGDFDIHTPKQAKAEMYKIFDLLNIT